MPTKEEDEQFYRDTERIAFPKIDDRQRAMLEPLGKRRLVRRGEYVIKAGERDLGLVVVLSGQLEVFEHRDGEELILATPGPRDFTGDISMLAGTAALGSTRGLAEESEILELGARELRAALAELPGLGDPIVKALMMRRKRLLRDRDFAGFRVIASEGSREGHELHDFLQKNHVPHRLITVQEPDGQRMAERFNLS